MRSLYDWARKKIHSPYASLVLIVLLFIEAFFLMPANTLLTIYGVERPKHIFWYATIGLLASIVGGITAYGLGWLLWYAHFEKILYYIITEDKLQEFIEVYRKNEVLTVFSISLLPIPYKIVTLTAGFCRLPFLPFFLSIASARCIRFYTLAAGLYLFGPKIQSLIDRYFYLFVALTISIIILSIVFLHR